MRAGSVIARVLPQKDDDAAFVVGVARIEATDEALVEGIRSTETFRGGEGVIETGRFGTPPSVEDLQPLVFDRQDLEDLRKSRIGDCDCPRWFGGMLLGKIRREIRSALSWDLMRTKRRLEARSEN